MNSNTLTALVVGFFLGIICGWSMCVVSVVKHS